MARRVGPRRRIHRLALLAATFLVTVAAAPASTPRPVATTTPSPTASPAGAARPAATANPALPAYVAYFNWYDRASPGMTNDNIHIVNPSPSTSATGQVVLGGTAIPFSVAPGQETYVAFPAGTIGGPVEVQAGAPVVASQRVAYYRSFSEVPGLDATAAVTDAWWPWYDRLSAGVIADNLHVVNPDATVTATVTFTLGTLSTVVQVGPGAEAFGSFPAGTMGGPVHMASDHPVLASQRVANKTSFNELPALATTSAATTLVSNWYDLATAGFSADNIHIVNVSATGANVTVSLNGTGYGTFAVPSHGEQYLSFPVGTIGGPLKLASDQPIVATQRVIYYDAFQETAFHSVASSATDIWFNWYDNASPCFLADNVHLTNAGGAAVSGSMAMPGRPTLAFTLNPGQETILNWGAGTMGGPVHIAASGSGVIADKRVVMCPPPPPPPPPVTHRIVVSLSQQHLWAYDNGRLWLETDVTTGRPELPTPAGNYHIFYKTSPYEMISPWPYGSPYWYPDAWVNWVLEFIQGGYFLHDAPWRTWFGPGSEYGDGTHGCVNIPNGPMLQLYNWAQLGDEVDVVN